MKKIQILALAAIAGLGFAGCVNDGGSRQSDTTGEAMLVVKLSDGTPRKVVRSIEDAAVQGALTLDLPNSEIFIIDANGNVKKHVQLESNATNGVGQVIGNVTLDSKVYVVANMPATEYTRISTLGTLAEIKKASSLISLQQGVVPVAINDGGNAVGVTVDPSDATKATADLTLVPAIARLEVGAIQCGSDATGQITEFTVTGIYVDKYYNKFTYSGNGEGEVVLQNVAELATWGLKDDAGWEAVSGVAKPADGKVWAYNVAAGNCPLIIVRLSGIKWIPAGLTERDLAGDYYLTVTGYKNARTFVAGQVYRVGKLNQAGDASDFVFTPRHLGATPNESEVDLTLTVHNIGWTLNDDQVILDK